METKIITGLMLLFSLMLIVGVAWPIAHFAPRRMAAKKIANIARHAEAVDALEVALARAGNDPAQQRRLADSLAWHSAALRALAPEMAAARKANAVPLAA
jgi:hypothetical protein